MKKSIICHVGPGEDVPGGMLSVIKGYMGSQYLKKYEQVYITSATADNKIKCFISSYKSLKKLIKIKKVNVVHIHMSERGSCLRAIFFVRLCKLYNIPTVIHSHGSEIENWYASINSLIRYIFNKSMNNASSIIVLTPGWIEFWKKIVNEKKICVIPNYVVIGEYQQKEYFLKNRLNVLFMGQIGNRKGTFDLVRAIKILKDKGYIAHLNICGDGERNKCDILINALQLEREVETLGWVHGLQKQELLNEADCLVLPSKYESFGIVLLEGMANQLPCICGDGGYSKEILENNIDGFIVESGNADSIAEALLKLYDSNRIKVMGEQAYKNVKEKYSEENVLKTLIRLYDSLITK